MGCYSTLQLARFCKMSTFNGWLLPKVKPRNLDSPSMANTVSYLPRQEVTTPFRSAAFPGPSQEFLTGFTGGLEKHPPKNTGSIPAEPNTVYHHHHHHHHHHRLCRKCLLHMSCQRYAPNYQMLMHFTVILHDSLGHRKFS